MLVDHVADIARTAWRVCRLLISLDPYRPDIAARCNFLARRQTTRRTRVAPAGVQIRVWASVKENGNFGRPEPLTACALARSERTGHYRHNSTLIRPQAGVIAPSQRQRYRLSPLSIPMLNMHTKN